MKYLLVCSSPFENSTLSKISKNVIENLIGDNEIYCLAHCENQTIYKNIKMLQFVLFSILKINLKKH